MRRVHELLLTVAGTNRAVLEQAPSEATKQAAMGGVILMTAALATLSASVALTMAVDAPAWAALLGGLAWGVAILNLDRWLVVASPRQRHPLLTLAFALPRVALAVVIGLVVSTPLTLLVFDDEIATRMSAGRQAELDQFEQTLRDDARFAGLDADRERVTALQRTIASGGAPGDLLDHPEVKDLRDRLAAVEADYRTAELEVACEKEGTCGSGRAGVGPAAQDKEARRDRLAAERQSLAAELEATKAEVSAAAEREAAATVADAEVELAALQERITAAETARARTVAEHEARVADDDGLLSRLGAMRELEETDESLRTTHLVLFLFLTAIECLAVLFKTLLSMGRPSLYDRLLSTEEQRVIDRTLLRHEVEYDEAHLVAEAARNAARARAATQLDAEVRTAKLVLQAQVDLAAAAVSSWKQGQAERLADELSGWPPATDVRLSATIDLTKPGGRGDRAGDPRA